MKIGVYTDEPVSAQGLLTVITREHDHEGQWIAANVLGTLNGALEQDLGMVVIDCSACDPLAVAGEILRLKPATLLVLWTRELAIEVVGAALGMGVRGIVRKTSSPEQIRLAFRVIAEGELWLERKLTSELLATQQIHLTPRESELVVLVSRGLKNREIAEEMSLTEGTVKIYLSRIFEKTGARDRLSLALLGLQRTVQSRTNIIVRQIVPMNSATRQQHHLRTNAQRTEFATPAEQIRLRSRGNMLQPSP